MNEAALIAGMAAVTFAVRYPVLALLGKIELPPLALRALRYVPAAVLTTITIPAIVMPTGDQLDISPANAYLIGGIAAALVSWKSKSLLLTIIAGMVTFFAWRALFPV